MISALTFPSTLQEQVSDDYCIGDHIELIKSPCFCPYNLRFREVSINTSGRWTCRALFAMLTKPKSMSQLGYFSTNCNFKSNLLKTRTSEREISDNWQYNRGIKLAFYSNFDFLLNTWKI